MCVGVEVGESVSATVGGRGGKAVGVSASSIEDVNVGAGISITGVPTVVDNMPGS